MDRVKKAASIAWQNIEYYRLAIDESKTNVHRLYDQRFNKDMTLSTLFSIAENLDVEPMLLLETDVNDDSDLELAYRMVASDLKLDVSTVKEFPEKIEELKSLLGGICFV